MASALVAAGLTVAAARPSGCYVLQAMKHREPPVKQVFQSPPKPASSGGYYRDGLNPKDKMRSSINAGISPAASKGTI
uniref:Uncharacterized protein n=1 Tax=Ailuropoda melanoleuca TaxID=9646 RepID=A0A7N5KGU7_AILME